MRKRVITARALREVLIAIVDRRYPAKSPEETLKLIEQAIPDEAEFNSDFHHDDFKVAKKEHTS